MLFLYFKRYVNCTSTFYTPIFQGYTRRGGGGEVEGVSTPYLGLYEEALLRRVSFLRLQECVKGNDYMKV